MGYGSDGLTFNTLRGANLRHCADMERERNHVIDDLKRTGLRKMCHQCGKWHDDSTRVTYTNTVPPGHTEPTPLGDVYMCVDCSPHNWIKPNTK
jgi:hypothetical protein